MRTPRAERRSAVRARTRLRPGKVLDAAGEFLADCAILDRSATGARIKLFAPVEPAQELQLLDEGQRATFQMRMVWQHAGKAGLSIEDEAIRLERREFLAAAGPYYAVR